MSEVRNFTFSYKEVAAALVRDQGLHEGLWGIYMEFGLAAANITAPNESGVMPAAVVPVVKIGIQRVDAASNLTVDAAEVNPGPKARAARPGRKVEST